ncbi:hypothetical protein C8R21_1392 [Nitrosospira multiformis]|uniref:Uncharacterized protein n=1 Tax=Nitrosospira multiformis TaxID=1231 RepID=A0A2T5I548_9PROT|nr:hypothetical protein C8R21_1392 [Nitrosospira multiformis]
MANSKAFERYYKFYALLLSRLAEGTCKELKHAAGNFPGRCHNLDRCRKPKRRHELRLLSTDLSTPIGENSVGGQRPKKFVQVAISVQKQVVRSMDGHNLAQQGVL